jgi:predicted RNA binding protein YcfA (HicA-like mRNA interferase family)
VSLKPIKANELIKLLAKIGYVSIRQRGSHVLIEEPPSIGKTTLARPLLRLSVASLNVSR